MSWIQYTVPLIHQEAELSGKFLDDESSSLSLVFLFRRRRRRRRRVDVSPVLIKKPITL